MPTNATPKTLKCKLYMFIFKFPWKDLCTLCRRLIYKSHTTGIASFRQPNDIRVLAHCFSLQHESNAN